MKFTANGLPIQTPVVKANSIIYCHSGDVSNGDVPPYEDLIGHAVDLVRYYAGKLGFTPEQALERYGKGEITVADDPESP